jgi:anti-sigma B factor antagonist
MGLFSIEVIERAPAVVLRLKGEARIDLSALDMQATRLSALRPAIVVLDMADLTFCASVGMRSVLSLRQRLFQVGSITRLAAVHPDVLDAFKRAAILPLLEVFPTVDQAVAAPIGPKASSAGA